MGRVSGEGGSARSDEALGKCGGTATGRRRRLARDVVLPEMRKTHQRSSGLPTRSDVSDSATTQRKRRRSHDGAELSRGCPGATSGVDWSDLPEGILLNVLDMLFREPNGRQLVYTCGQVCKGWHEDAMDVLMRDTAVSGPRRHLRVVRGEPSSLKVDPSETTNEARAMSTVESMEDCSSKRRAVPGEASNADGGGGVGDAGAPSTVAVVGWDGEAEVSHRRRDGAAAEDEWADDAQGGAGRGAGQHSGAGGTVGQGSDGCGAPRAMPSDASVEFTGGLAEDAADVARSRGPGGLFAAVRWGWGF